MHLQSSIVLVAALIAISSTAFSPVPFPAVAGRGTVRRLASLDKSADELNLEAERLRLQAGRLRLEVQQAELEKSQELLAKALGTAGERTEKQVLEANQKFIDAFRSKSVPKMKKIWCHRSHAVLTHVGKPMIRGIDAVCSSFHNAFKGASIDTVEVTDERVVALSSQIGVVTCTMDITGGNYDAKSSWVTTNVFNYDEREERWMLVEHHSSPVLFPAVPPQME